MADFHPVEYAQSHPYIVGGVVFVGGFAILYMLGYIGGGSSTANSGAANMAAAYYAAEAAQTQAGTALNIATVQANAQTQGQQINAAAAVAINQSNNTASTANTASMYAADMQDTATTTAATTQQTAILAGLGSTQANDAMNTAVAQAGYNYQTAKAGYDATTLQTAMQTIMPQELAASGGFGRFVLPGVGYAGVDTGAAVNINDLISQGYAPGQAAQIASANAGVPLTGAAPGY